MGSCNETTYVRQCVKRLNKSGLIVTPIVRGRCTFNVKIERKHLKNTRELGIRIYQLNGKNKLHSLKLNVKIRDKLLPGKPVDRSTPCVVPREVSRYSTTSLPLEPTLIKLNRLRFTLQSSLHPLKEHLDKSFQSVDIKLTTAGKDGKKIRFKVDIVELPQINQEKITRHVDSTIVKILREQIKDLKEQLNQKTIIKKTMYQWCYPHRTSFLCLAPKEDPGMKPWINLGRKAAQRNTQYYHHGNLPYMENLNPRWGLSRAQLRSIGHEGLRHEFNLGRLVSMLSYRQRLDNHAYADIATVINKHHTKPWKGRRK